jgi:23S rRNA (adenine2030-N6)-methyltransferase
MLSYRHSFHAGNFADTFKHLTLCLLLEYLTRKDKPLFYLDTHAGAGVYPMDSVQAQKTGEHLWGINKILPNLSTAPQDARPWLDALAQIRNSRPGHIYPGSPAFAQQLLRQQDRLNLHELHPGDAEKLEIYMGHDRRISVEKSDGLHALKAKLPPKEKRGLIFIDPPYELTKEYDTVAAALNEGMRRFATGTYALWYPVLKDGSNRPALTRMKKAIQHETLEITLSLDTPDFPWNMNGCGLLIINPPWTLKAQLQNCLPWLCNALAGKQAHFTL